jgi:phosphoribosylformylglycinamidine cyclo-ligase
MAKTYQDAGVDIEKGDRFAEFIRSYKSPSVAGNIGSFAGGFELDIKRYSQPVIMTSTDGVGTKLIIAQKLGVYDTVGIDLVAMCVNDLIAVGAEPKSFLDYIACGRINEKILQDIIKGVINGCDQAECILGGGETAEMPDMYNADDFDLAGFSVGVAEKGQILPRTASIDSETILFGLPSNGIHSNGFSLARKVLPVDDELILNELLKPTKIYVKEIKALLKCGFITGIAHITGGGLEGNIQRILPEAYETELSYSWERPGIFDSIQSKGNIAEDEMRRVFNLGLGMVLAVPGPAGEAFSNFAANADVGVLPVGRVVQKTH